MRLQRPLHRLLRAIRPSAHPPSFSPPVLYLSRVGTSDEKSPTSVFNQELKLFFARPPSLGLDLGLGLSPLPLPFRTLPLLP